MPEMKKVYNLKTGEVRAMYSVDANEAIRNAPKEWSFTAPDARKGTRPEDVTGLSPGVITPGKGEKIPERGDDGFTRQVQALPESSGQNRVLGHADGTVDTDARRGSKEEQIAASNTPSATDAKGVKAKDTDKT